MRTFKLDCLFILVDLDNPGKIYPKIFLYEDDAQKCIKIIGGNWKIHDCFINES